MFKQKKAALELSIGTMVIIVLAMAMLILGLVLVKQIFSGVTDNVTELNNKVKDQIKGLFQDEKQRVIIRLTEDKAIVKQGEEFGIAFGVRNLNEGVTGAKKYNYEVELNDPDIVKNCGVSADVALSWVKFGKGSLSIAAGQIGYDRFVFNVPETAPICTTKYRLTVWEDGTPKTSPYEEAPFFLQIRSAGLF